MDRQPLRLVLEGREDPMQHKKVSYVLRDFDINVRDDPPSPPIAGVPLTRSEALIAMRGKIRPVILLSVLHKYPSPARDETRWQTAPYMMAVPWYGIAAGRRAGWQDEFVMRIRALEFPQYFWDIHPETKEESILRFDQTIPIPANPRAIRPTRFRLSDDAIELMLEWQRWFFTGLLPENGIVFSLRKDLARLLE